MIHMLERHCSYLGKCFDSGVVYNTKLATLVPLSVDHDDRLQSSDCLSYIKPALFYKPCIVILSSSDCSLAFRLYRVDHQATRHESPCATQTWASPKDYRWNKIMDRRVGVDLFFIISTLIQFGSFIHCREIDSCIARQLSRDTCAALNEAISHEVKPGDRDWNDFVRTIGLPEEFPLLASDTELQNKSLDSLRALLHSLSGRQLSASSSAQITRTKYYKLLLLRVIQAVHSTSQVQATHQQSQSSSNPPSGPAP